MLLHFSFNFVVFLSYIPLIDVFLLENSFFRGLKLFFLEKIFYTLSIEILHSSLLSKFVEILNKTYDTANLFVENESRANLLRDGKLLVINTIRKMLSLCQTKWSMPLELIPVSITFTFSK